MVVIVVADVVVGVVGIVFDDVVVFIGVDGAVCCVVDGVVVVFGIRVVVIG